MNKIYQVIWSHVKHCYVVTSELAKRHGKGCGARSLRMAAVSMGVAAALIGGIGGSVAEAEGVGRVEEGGSGTFPVGSRYYSAEGLHWNPSTKSVTVTAGSPVSIEPLSSTEPVPTVSTEIEAKRYIIGNIVYQNSSIATNVLVDAETAKYKFEGGTLKRYYTNPGMIAQQYQQHIDDYSDTNKDVSGYSVTVDMGSSGSESKDEAYGGYSQFGKASDNSVTVKSGVLNKVHGGYSSSSDTTGNSVTITGGTVTGDVLGGLSPNGDTNENKVIISGGTIGTSEANSIIGGGSGSADANNNTVEISGGTINSTIWGGRSNSGNAEGNTVTISGSPTFAASSGIHGAAAYDGDAKNNTVNILVKDFSIGFLIGGEPGPSGTSSGNTLNIAAKGVTTGSVNAFQNMNFYLPSDIANNDTMLTVNGGTVTDVKDVTFGVAALSGVKLEKGNMVNLITNPSGLTTDDTLKTTDSATLGTASFLAPHNLAYDDKITLSISKKDANTIIATVDNITADSGSGDSGNSNANSGNGGSGNSNENNNSNSGGGNNNNNTDAGNPDRLKSPVETRAGVVTMINAGADLMAGQGMQNAADAAAAERASADGVAAPRAGSFAPFAAVGGSSLRAQSGSHVDTKGISLGLGFAREIENKQGKLLIGPIVEYGHGKYDSYQDNGIKADGNSNYWGLGLIARQTNHNGFYYEGSLRGGRTKSDYSSQLSPVTHASYDSRATYFAAHIGIGKLVDIGHDNTLDYYGKYFYSHTGGDSPEIYINGAPGGKMDFDGVDSNRIRLGARVTHALNEKNKIYGGLAYQYEFSGEARATYLGNTAPSPSVKGSSGMLELGWQVKPGRSPMVIDLNVTGWAGKQRGITANLQANWTF